MSFKNQVIYQIYPKSFYDSDGDGVGDLRGVIEKIPYIASLGVDMVWLNPFFASPQHDNGYDISDYYSIDPGMGSMRDLEELIAGLARHGIGVMFDMVLNHVSTEHEWFQRALAGDQFYRDFFYLRLGRPDGLPPTNWESKFGGSAWEPFGDTGLYYLHLYDRTQADLNWHNPRVRQELFRVVNFWLDKGVRGLRFDVLNVIGKAEKLEDAAGVPDKSLYTDTARIHPWVQQMHRETFGRFLETVTVGEMSSTTIENAVKYTNPANKELSMIFSFHHLKVDYLNGEKWSRMPFDFMELKGLLNRWAEGMQDGGGWNALFWNNHDQPRALNRFGDPHNFHYESATMLASVIHLHRGTPFVYMGEELGMVDPVYSGIDDYVDVEARTAYRMLRDRGLSESDAFTTVHAKARDNSRTPMQWSAEKNAGFTTGAPWLRPTTFDTINVAAEERSGRILPYYRRLIQLRKDHAVISEGSYRPYAPDHPAVYAYIREHGGRRLLVLTNFYGEPTSVDIPPEFVDGRVLISNYPVDAVSGSFQLAPYQATAIHL